MFLKHNFLFLPILFFSVASLQVPNGSRSFMIGYNEDCFLKDGECFRYVSGSMHYFRVPRPYWKDRMMKMRAAGLNALETYIEWSSHEERPGQFRFSDNLDIVEYIKTAEESGLLVIIRPGPFIDAERDMGGLPSWLLKMNKNIRLRTSDPTFMFYVERFFSKLLPLLKPLLYVNGGPVISVQVENEYGSYFACDRDYTARLRYVLEQGLGPDVVLFTTDGDGDNFILCGQVDGAYTTVDFGTGTDVTTAFAPQRKKEPKGPLVNSEFYPGWLDHWGQLHANVPGSSVVKTLNDILAINASVNIYMMHGGTSFGFTAGANLDGNETHFCPTSYDYDAPISEAGDLTTKFMQIREVVGKYLPLPPDPLPHNSTKIAFGPVQLNRLYSIFDLISQKEPIVNKYPLTFEELDVINGFVYYQSTIGFIPTDPALLSIPGIKDRRYVFVNEVFQGILSQGEAIYSLPVLVQAGQHISIFVENQGRICVGSHINDFKGILGNVTLGKTQLLNWRMWPLEIISPNASVDALPNVPDDEQKYLQDTSNVLPAVYGGKFVLPEELQPADTFLRLDGWYKGMGIMNNFNLGRYWPIVGPQVTLYVPGVLLLPHPQKNNILLFELESAPCPSSGAGCSVTFVTDHVINGPVPKKK